MQIGLEGGFQLTLALLREVRDMKKEALVNVLEHVYQILKSTPGGSLYNTDKLSFLLDNSLNDAREFLISIIEDK